MIKDFLIVRTLPAAPLEKLQHYLEHRHAPLALSVPIVSRQMQRYTMNHMSEERAAGCALYGPIAGLAAVVEHDVGGWDGLNSIMADAQYLAEVRPDEEHMVTNLMDGWPQLIVVDEEETIFSSDPPEGTRLFDFVRRPIGMPREDFVLGLKDDAAWATAQPDYRTSVGKRVHSLVVAGSAPMGVDGEAFDAVIETWIVDPEQLANLVDQQKARRAAFCDPIRSFTAVTRERRIRG